MPEPQQQSSADNAVHVVGPDGKHYKFPPGTTRDKAVEYFKKKGVTTGASKTTPKSAKQATPDAPTAGSSTDKNPLTRTGKEFWTSPDGLGRKIEVGAGLGAQEAFGIKPPVEGDPTSTTWGSVAHQVLGNLGGAAADSLKQWGPIAPIDLVAKMIEGTASGIERGGKQVVEGVKKGDPEEIARGAIGGGASAGMAVEGGEAASKMADRISNLPNVPLKTIFSMEKMQGLMDDYIHARGLDLKGTYETAMKKVNSEIGRFTDALNKALPSNAIDATKIHADAMKAIDDVVKTPNKYDPVVQQIAQSIKAHPPGFWDFETAKQFRTNVYAAMSRTTGAMNSALTKTYGDLTSAMEKAAKTVKGGDYAWSFYNDLTKRFHENFGDHVQGILDADSGAKVSGKLLADRTLSREAVKSLAKYGLDSDKVNKFIKQAEQVVKAKKFMGNSMMRYVYGTKAGAAAFFGSRMMGNNWVTSLPPAILAGLSASYLKNLRTLLDLDPSIIEKVEKARELPKADPNIPLPSPRGAAPAATPGTPASPGGIPPTPVAAPPGAPTPTPKITPLTAAQKLALRKQATTSQQTASAAGTPTGPGAQASTTGSPSAESSTANNTPEKTAMELEREELLAKAGKDVVKTTKAFEQVEKGTANQTATPTPTATPEVKKIPEGEHGSEHERLKEKDRERKAKQREQSVRTEVKGAGDKIAAGAVGHASLNEDLPTIELEHNLSGDSPEGKTLVSALRKMAKTEKWDDDVYRGHLLEAVKGYEKRIAKKRSSQ